MSKTNLKFSAICGLVAPIIFAVVVLVVAGMQSGYSHLHQYISELGASGMPQALWINYPGIFLFGVILIAFIPAFYQLIRPGKRAMVACVLLVLTGIGFMLLAILPCDAGCSLTSPSKVALAHNNVAIISFILIIAIPLNLGARSFFSQHGKGYYQFCLLIGFLLALTFIKIVIMGYQVPYVGLFQRIFMCLFSIWLMVSAWLALRRVSTD